MEWIRKNSISQVNLLKFNSDGMEFYWGWKLFEFDGAI